MFPPSYSYIIRMIKSKIMMQVENVSLIGGVRNTYKILIWKLECSRDI
jgi:hypothetical protein